MGGVAEIGYPLIDPYDNPEADPRAPLGRWTAIVQAVGDASGGLLEVTLDFPPRYGWLIETVDVSELNVKAICDVQLVEYVTKFGRGYVIPLAGWEALGNVSRVNPSYSIPPYPLGKRIIVPIANIPAYIHAAIVNSATWALSVTAAGYYYDERSIKHYDPIIP